MRLRISSHISSSKLILILFIMSIALIPTLVGPIRLEDIILGLIIIYTLLYKKLLIKANNYTFIVSLLVISFLSIMAGYLINFKGSSIRDLISWIKIIKYVSIYIIIRYTFISREVNIPSFLKIMVNIGLLSSFVGLLQYFNLLGINSWLTPIYDDNPFRLSFLVNNLPGRRIIGTSFNPNYFGMYQVILILTSFILAKHYRNKIHWAYMLFFIIILILSKSRTGLLAVTFSLAMSYIFSLFQKRRYILIFLIAGIFVGSLFLIVNIADRPPFGNMAFFQRFKKSQFDLNQRNSLSVRIEVWQEFSNWFKNNPKAWLFGVGPQKNDTGVTIDSEYFELLRSMGITGFLLVFFLELYILYKSLKIFSSSKKNDIRAIAHYTLLLIIALLIFNLTAKMMADIQNISFILISAAFFFRKIRMVTSTD